MGHARRRDADEARPAQHADAVETRKDQPLSLGLSLLIWFVMAGLAWAAVALVLRLS
ncbi:hypothetical protein LJR219_002396 [Phenylobacterium sp. LjRoot219]|jgi:hypothetical protein|uniref:hypothetical protein n=1 Tax=Phenylobacterium sp. LjRoot219 TaxID=3342283 RepID=UPI003ECC426F